MATRPFKLIIAAMLLLWDAERGYRFFCAGKAVKNAETGPGHGSEAATRRVRGTGSSVLLSLGKQTNGGKAIRKERTWQHAFAVSTLR
jgi:hypothetical protein